MRQKKKGRNFKQEQTRIYDDSQIDSYREEEKYKEPTQCPKCGALFVGGRWTWKDTSKEIHSAVCPACKRIEDNYPAGFLTLSGSFFVEHRNEILNLVENIKKAEREEHPLERIMEIEEQNDKTIITTTGLHLSRRIGDALKNAYEGELDTSYDAENYVRISWHR
jgi:NMD protein affecting ribosome stability and mRNA decay